MGGREFADGTDERPSLPGRCGGPPTMETMPATGGTVDLRDKLSDTNDAAVETGSGEFEAEIEKHEISRGPEERWD